jgi:hypothetical protein
MKSLTVRINFKVEDIDDQDNHFYMKKTFLGDTSEIFDQFFKELKSLEKEGAVIENVFTKYTF